MISDKKFEIRPEFREEALPPPRKPKKSSSDSFGDWLAESLIWLIGGD